MSTTEETPSSILYNSSQDYFPSLKTKIIKSSRSPENKLSLFAKQLDSEKSSEFTPLKDNDALTFSDLDSKLNENTLKDDLTKKKIDILESTLIEIKRQLDINKKKCDEFEKTEAKLKGFVNNLLEVNSKLSQKVRKNENNSNLPSNSLENRIDQLEKSLKEVNEERDILHNQKIDLNQKLENLLKKDVLKEKSIDFYKNRIKLYQFKLQNYPKSDKQEIKFLEDYIMKLLGENSKLNKALEKSEKEGKKWKDKYFDFEVKKEQLLKEDTDICNEKKTVNNSDENSAKSIPIFHSLWSCKPESK